jgi:CRP/FNR family cyclic AMP-dependent transcriptional regulator
MSDDAPFADLQVFRPGAVLILEGEQTGALYVLKSGHLQVTRAGVPVADVDQPGAVLGEIGVLLGTPHSASVQAVAASEVYVIEDAVAALESRPAWMLQIAKILARRVVATTAALVESRQATPTEVFVLPDTTVAQLGDPQV